MFQFEVYCLDTYEFLLTTWPWIRVSETVHRLLAHTTDIIILNKNQGLVRISEQGSESMHKVQRLTRAAGARKTSLLLGDVDMFRRGWATSSPALRLWISIRGAASARHPHTSLVAAGLSTMACPYSTMTHWLNPSFVQLPMSQRSRRTFYRFICFLL